MLLCLILSEQVFSIDFFLWSLFAIVLMFGIGALLISFVLKKRRFNRKTPGRATYWSLIITIFLILVVLALYLSFVSKGEVGTLVTILVIPVLVGLITSFVTPLIQLVNDNHIEEQMLSTVPIKVYPQRQTPGGTLRDDLIDDLEKTTRYKYSGIRMTVCAKCLEEVFDSQKTTINSVHFFIPKPENNQLSGKDLNEMKQSLRTIKEVFLNSKYTHKIELKFTLFGFVPPFHIHQTNNKCWFALVENNAAGIPYPTTYLYEKTLIEKTSDDAKTSIEMYYTLDKMLKALEDSVSSKGVENHLITVNANSSKEDREKAFQITRKNEKIDVINLITDRIDKNIQKKSRQNKIHEKA